MKFSVQLTPNGSEDVWEDPDPDASYVLGADVAQGSTFGVTNERGDWSTFSLWKRDPFNLVQVAECRTRAENFIFGQMIAVWGARYNHAVVNVERNLAHGVIAGLRAANYPQYKWFVPPMHASTMESLQGQWFFHKNRVSQRMLMDTFKNYWTSRMIVQSERLVEEASHLRKGEDGVPNTNGKDLIIAAAMAVIVDAYSEMPEVVPVKERVEKAPSLRDERYDQAHWKKPEVVSDDAPVGFDDSSLFSPTDDGWTAWH
jgi:hypothetical protein